MSIVAVRRLPFVGTRSKRPSPAAPRPPPTKRAGGDKGSGGGGPVEENLDFKGELGSGGGGPEESVENLGFEGALNAAVKEFGVLLSVLTELYKTEEVEMEELVKRARTGFDNLSQKLFTLSGALMLSELGEVPPQAGDA